MGVGLMDGETGECGLMYGDMGECWVDGWRDGWVLG